MNLKLTTVLVAVGLFIGASTADAQVACPVPGDPSCDHLKCYRVKVQGNASGLPDVPIEFMENQFGVEANCEVEVPPLFFCSHTRKEGKDDPRGLPANDYLCYDVMCNQFDPAPGITPLQRVIAQGQIADRIPQLPGGWPIRINLRKPKVLCVPVEKLFPRPGTPN